MVFKSRMIRGGTVGDFNADATVKSHLSNGAKTSRQVKTFLKEKGSEYTTDGVIKLLNRLIKKGYVKRKDHGKMPSIYYLTDRGIHDTGLMANFFQNTAISVSLNNISPIIQGKKEIVIKKVVDIGGLFNVYSYLVSLDFTGKQQQVEEKWMEWFDNIGTPIDLIIWLEDYLITFWPENEKKPEVSKTLQRTLNKKAAQKFKKILHTLYPEEMKIYDTQFHELEEKIKNYRNQIKNYQSLVKQSNDSMKELLSEL